MSVIYTHTDYLTVKDAERLVANREHTEEVKTGDGDRLTGRIAELEKISAKFTVLEQLKNRMDLISKTITENEDKLRKEVTRVEKVQVEMITVSCVLFDLINLHSVMVNDVTDASIICRSNHMAPMQSISSK